MRTISNVDMGSKEADVVESLEYWLGVAEQKGLIVTVERVARAPLAMGNADTVMTVRREVNHVGEAAVRGGYAK